MRPIVIKVGGELFETGKIPALAKDIATLRGRGVPVMVVHGGGPQSSALQKQLGQTPNIVGGRRVTDAETLRVVKMVVAGQLNIDLCAALLAAGAKPIGLNGASSLAIAASKRPPSHYPGGGDTLVDFGFVGDVTGINHELLQLLVDNGYVPVLACLAADHDGTIYNINADVVANQLAAALKAQHLVLVTSTAGVLRDVSEPTSRIAVLRAAEAEAAIEDGSISGGMIPKIHESLRGLAQGIGAVHIIGPDSGLLSEIDNPGYGGTALLP